MTTRRLPPWIRTTPAAASVAAEIRARTYDRNLVTVCREARCPNQSECARQGVATYLILGDTCSRDCRFCAVRHGSPLPLDPTEAETVALCVKRSGLNYTVITSVTRDDLPDGGASVFAVTVRAIRRACPATAVELLIPDFQGSAESLEAVVNSQPEVIGHNLETVPRLYPAVRQGASYTRSLQLIEMVSQRGDSIVTKSGIMVGLGENRDELLDVIRDLAAVRCKILTIGQYLRPSRTHFPVHRFVRPEEFEELRAAALSLGIERVAAAPLVRSSFKAAEMFAEVRAEASSGGSQPSPTL
jgi:lipoyl synthase